MRAPRVVIFEADHAYADELRRAFAHRGCEVLLHHDGADAAEFAEGVAPHLIVLSVELPNRNGFAICNQLKRHPVLASVPLMLISAHSPPESFDQHAKLRTRADDYAHKPIRAEDLVQRCVALLPTHGASDESGVIEVSDEAMEDLRPPMRAGDSDVSNITDAAFDHIMLEDGSRPPPTADDVVMPDGLPPVPDDFEDFTTVSSMASLRLPADLLAARPSPPTVRPSNSVAPQRPTAPPPVPRAAGPSIRPNTAELDALREQVASLESSLTDAQRLAHDAVAQQAHAERARSEAEDALRAAHRELDELKGRAARPAGSTREFLELRESLNRKDKEILGFREQLNLRDRELLELRDKILQQDLTRADLDDRLEERERELATLRENLTAQAEGARRRDEELSGQLTALRAEGEALTAALLAARADAEAEAQARARAAEAERLAAASALAEALRAGEAEREAAVATAWREARTQREAAIAELRQEAEAAAAEAQRAHAAVITALREEHEQALSLRVAALEAEREEGREALRLRDVAHAGRSRRRARSVTRWSPRSTPRAPRSRRAAPRTARSARRCSRRWMRCARASRSSRRGPRSATPSSSAPATPQRSPRRCSKSSPTPTARR
ncbi:MAG: response regulator [Polyangiales bacterium]